MTTVSRAPGKVWSQEERMEDEADSVVDELAGGKGGVTALVAQNPDPGPVQTLEEAPDGPRHAAKPKVLDHGDVLVAHVDAKSSHGNIAEEVEERQVVLRNEAVSRNRLTKLLDVYVLAGNVAGDIRQVGRMSLVVNDYRRGGDGSHPERVD